MAGMRIAGSAVVAPTGELAYTVLEDDANGFQAVWCLIGGVPTRIYGDAGEDEPNNAILSPSGTLIAVNDNFPGPNGEGQIKTSAAEAAVSPTVVSDDDAGAPWMIHPSWRPDNGGLVYVHAAPTEGFNGSIVAVDLDTPGTETVLYTPAVVGAPGGHGPYRPQYNRDGTKIAFILNAEAGGSTAITGLYVMDADGSNVTMIDNWTDGYGFNGSQFQWTPDDRIVYWDSNGDDLWIIDADGSNKTQLNTDGTTSGRACRVTNRCLDTGDGFVIGTTPAAFEIWRWELDGSGGIMLYDDGPGTIQNFQCVYVGPDNRIYWVYQLTPGKIASVAIDGSDFVINHDTSTSGIGTPSFAAGSGIEWI